MKCKFKAALFDLDGTLSNSVPVILHCASIVHKEMDLPWDEERQRSFISLPVRDTAPLVCPPEKIEAYLEKLRDTNRAWLPKLLKPFDGAVELVRDLVADGVKVGIVTSRQNYGAKLSAEVIGIDEYLSVLVGIDDVVNNKPAAEPAEKAMAALNVQPEDCVFIGDSHVDVGCGKNAGLYTIGVTWGTGTQETLSAAEPDLICDTMDELYKALLG